MINDLSPLASAVGRRLFSRVLFLIARLQQIGAQMSTPNAFAVFYGQNETKEKTMTGQVWSVF